MAELIVADATAAPGSPTRRYFDERKANHHPDVRGKHDYVNSARHANYVDVDSYLRAIAEVKAPLAGLGDGSGSLPAPIGPRLAAGRR